MLKELSYSIMPSELGCQAAASCAAGRDLSEREIRTTLLQKFTGGAVVLEEFTAAGGRLDVLEIYGEKLAGFEIKSDFDSLQRVDAQVASFSQYCDTLTFVAGRRLALPLLRTLPIWCGVLLAYRAISGKTILLPLRYPRINPFVTATASASLLRRDELLIKLSGKGRIRARRRELQDELLAALSFAEVRGCLASTLVLRERTRFDELQRSSGDLFPLEAKSKESPCGASGAP